jgi:hypothetical protein
MTVRHRPPRRQGVVYGPLVTRNQSEPGSVVGRVLGGIVIFGALAVLAVGALAVIGGNATPDATASATPTLAGLASPAPSSFPTILPSPTPTATISPSPAPSPTPFLVELVEGPGKITFASNYTSSLELIDPRVEFKIDERMAWRANIGEPVGRVRVDFDVYRVDTATMAETNVHSSSFVGQNASALFYYAKADVSHEVDGPGVFVMRYSVDGTTISEGYFRVTE